ncbi:unnamed protein product [Clonostachys rosea f. rosea IK726]|uniref:AAA+ ATPase domain-containing protein n=2 Tax=Bionectria ochroleuca TaxID=29856 RepID=A0A0B7JPC0_BIOOC|nr:unnamed protein product [Clonostachys rosea f. rosea IK726]
MSRNKALTVLQKTYDDSYLSCSTAVYHESQGNEVEAMRHWRNALDQIYDHNANKALPMYATKTDTERALIDALKELELQCKERIDLLEALRVSRQEAASSCSNSTNGKFINGQESSQAGGTSKGSIGDGTIPAVTYSQLSRPARPSPRSSRPPLPPRATSDAPAPSRASPSSSSTLNAVLSAPLDSTQRVPSPERSSAQDGHPTHSPSPDRYTMRTTLRSGRSSDKLPKGLRKSSKPAGEGPSKAATLAWSALSSREKASRASTSEKSSAPQSISQRHSAEHTRRTGSPHLHWDSHSRRLVTAREHDLAVNSGNVSGTRHSDEYLSPSNISVSAASSALNSTSALDHSSSDHGISRIERHPPSRSPASAPSKISRTEQRHDMAVSEGSAGVSGKSSYSLPIREKPIARRPVGTPKTQSEQGSESRRKKRHSSSHSGTLTSSDDGENEKRAVRPTPARRKTTESESTERPGSPDSSSTNEEVTEDTAWKKRKAAILKNLPSGIDETAAKQILNDIVVQGDEVRWGDVAGLEVAKNALREAVVYPFLRPDLFMGLREPARGMLLFGPPGTGKTMLARAVATESKSTFFSISASSLTSKFLGESEKLVKALFGLAKLLAPSIIFVDEIDSLLSQRSGSGEHEATRRIKTEFLIQWSDLQRAAAGRETTERDKERGDANRVLVLAATNLPWAIDEAARRRFVRRQYIPLPEPETRKTQLQTLLALQKHSLTEEDVDRLIELTDGFSGSDITALAKDAAMGPLRSLGDALLQMTMDEIRPIMLQDFENSLRSIRPSVGKAGLKEYEDWAKEFGERGG